MTTQEVSSMSTRHTLIAVIGCAAFAAGCGDDDSGSDRSSGSADTTKVVSVEERHAQLQNDPYDLRCADIRDKLTAGRITRVVQVALADDAEIRGLTRLQASQSIYYAITELCKAQPGSYKPAKDAVAGVRSGEFRAEL
jgi:hypothetical protein